jgi:Zn-dependent peptidase ImmA (M78 family)/transcriptional regulator with XRE-family HTH domain
MATTKKRKTIPITPSVLTWAMSEAGYTAETLADKLKVSPETVRAWESGEQKPTLTHFRQLATHLKRIPATLLLPRPPSTPSLPVKFRHPPGSTRTELNPVERRYVREAHRIQQTTAWLVRELGDRIPSLPQVNLSTDPERAGTDARRLLTGGANGSFGADWRNASQAFNAWRSQMEEAGVLVFLFTLGKDSCRGFSLWDDAAPIIAINTWWNTQARTFTLFHEYGHLLTRTSSACLEKSGRRSSVEDDDAERWCEQFAAAALIPRTELEGFLRQIGWNGRQITDLDIASRVATRFKVSLRAATLRLIEIRAADWPLYHEIPATSDAKPKGGGGGGGRDRGQIKEDQFGNRAVGLFVRAMDRNLLGRSDVLEYLDVPDAQLDRLHRRAVG